MEPREKFYTAEPEKKKVTREEFEDFIKNYPRKLEPDWDGVWEPALITYNDFELSNRWPHSSVVWTWDYDHNGYDIEYKEEETGIFI